MNYVSFESKTVITFIAKKNATLAKALNECVEFLKKESIFECELNYNGFTFLLDQEADININVLEYSNYLLNKQSKN